MGELALAMKDFGLLGVVAWVLYQLINGVIPALRGLQADHAAQQEQHAKQSQVLDEIVARARRMNGGG